VSFTNIGGLVPCFPEEVLRDPELLSPGGQETMNFGRGGEELCSRDPSRRSGKNSVPSRLKPKTSSSRLGRLQFRCTATRRACWRNCPPRHTRLQAKARQTSFQRIAPGRRQLNRLRSSSVSNHSHEMPMPPRAASTARGVATDSSSAVEEVGIDFVFQQRGGGCGDASIHHGKV
jgi:hypothetical protein